MKMHTKTINKLPGLVLFGLLLTLIMASNTSQAGMMDEPVVTKFAFDKFEITNGDDNPKVWEFDAWVKQDIKGLVFTSEGESVNGNTESESKLVYSYGIAPYWDVQAGLGYDTHEEHSHTWGVIGLSGMAPYFFETDIHGLIDGDGNLGIRAASELELLITQRLILVPEIEAEAYSADIPAMKIGSGFSSLGLSLRLKYEIKREFAPYIGYEWHKKYGNTANYSSEDEESSLVIGVSFWF